MKKFLFIALLIVSCKSFNSEADRDANRERMYEIAKGFGQSADFYQKDHSPAGTKHWKDALDSQRLYLDSAKFYMSDAAKALDRQLDSTARAKIEADKRYNDSVYAERKKP